MLECIVSQEINSFGTNARASVKGVFSKVAGHSELEMIRYDLTEKKYMVFLHMDIVCVFFCFVLFC